MMIPFERFTDKAKLALQKAQEVLFDTRQVQLDTEHILYGIAFVEGSIFADILRESGLEPERVLDKIRRAVTNRPQVEGAGGIAQAYVTPHVVRLFDLAFQEAKEMGDEYIGTEHLLLAMLELREGTAYRILNSFGLDKEKVLRSLKELRGYRRVDSATAEDTYRMLKRFTVDLTERARQGKLDPVIGREVEIQRVMEILSRRTKNNPVLIGDPGVGKTAIVEGLAQRIAEKKVPEPLMDKSVLQLDLPGLVAGTKFRGEFEDRMKALLEEIIKAKRSTILFIDELHTVVGAGAAEGAIDASNILKPALARGELQAVGATTISDYRKYIEKDKALERRFMPVLVEEPTPEVAVLMLKGLKPKYEEHHGIKITDGAIESAVRLSQRYITGRFLPDKAIDVIDEACARVRLRALPEKNKIAEITEKIDRLREEEAVKADAGDYESVAKIKTEIARMEEQLQEEKEKLQQLTASQVVDEEEVAQVVADLSGVPVPKVSLEERERFLKMEEELSKNLIGQKEAIALVSEVIRRAKSGLSDPNRPLGSFIFLGPTGVGKTELVKVLAEFLFGSRDALVRIDMSEYQEKHSVSRLVGAPPGYVGYEEGGQLTEAVKRQPFSIVLLDEFEKAHPEVFNLLLQVLDEGRLTDNKGVTVNFRNTVIVLTSNIGSSEILELSQGGKIGFKHEGRTYTDQDVKEVVFNILKRRVTPEFLNRIDEVIVFHQLSKEDVKAIARLQLKALQERLAERMISLEVSESAIEKLADEGFDPAFGARPMKRTIQRLVSNPISQKIISGEIKDGDKVVVNFVDGEFVFKVESKELVAVQK